LQQFEAEQEKTEEILFVSKYFAGNQEESEVLSEAALQQLFQSSIKKAKEEATPKK